MKSLIFFAFYLSLACAQQALPGYGVEQPQVPRVPPPVYEETDSGSLAEAQEHHHDSDDPLAWLRDSVPGEPGVDYPIFSRVPDTGFTCEGRAPGIYADERSRCQAWHQCYADQIWSFLCPNGTIFNQEIFTCVWWHDFDCSTASGFFRLNEDLYTETGSKGEGQGPRPIQPRPPSPVRPVPTQPAPRPTQPAPTRPAPRPTRPAPTRPAPRPTRPAPTRPAPRPTRPAPTRPAPRPTRPAPTRPAPRPTRPAPTRPAPQPTRPAPTRPAPRPTRPAPTRPAPRPTRPAPTRPAPRPTRPAPTRPAPQPTRTVPTRPAPRPTRPAPTRPALRPTRPAPTRPAPRPTRPAPTRPAPRPTRPAPTRPAPRPTRPAPTRPAPRPTRPAPTRPAPRPTRPAPTRPAPRPTRPAPTRPAPQPTRPAPRLTSKPEGYDYPTPENPFTLPPRKVTVQTATTPRPAPTTTEYIEPPLPIYGGPRIGRLGFALPDNIDAVPLRQPLSLRNGRRGVKRVRRRRKEGKRVVGAYLPTAQKQVENTVGLE